MWAWTTMVVCWQCMCASTCRAATRGTTRWGTVMITTTQLMSMSNRIGKQSVTKTNDCSSFNALVLHNRCLTRDASALKGERNNSNLYLSDGLTNRVRGRMLSCARDARRVLGAQDPHCDEHSLQVQITRP